MKTVAVKYPNHPSVYHYLTDIEGIEVGDTLVVDSPNNGMTCVKVVSADESEVGLAKATKWIVCKVDTAAYHGRVEREARRKLLIAKLKKMQEEALEANQFAALAALNPDAVALINELKSLA